MQPGYVRHAFVQPVLPTWRQRAVSALLSAAIIFALGLLLLMRSALPTVPPTADLALPTQFILLPPPSPPSPEPQRLAQRIANSGGSPKAAGPMKAARRPAEASGAPPDPTIEPLLKLRDVPLILPTTPPLPTIDNGAALAGRGAASGAGELGVGVDGLGGTGKGRGRGIGDGNGDGIASVIVPPRWVWKPEEADLAPYVPEAARRAKASGTVYLACQVLKSRRVRGCRVLAEQPAGMGFGSASLAASRIFRVHPERQDGKIVEDVWVGIPIHWTFKN